MKAQTSDTMTQLTAEQKKLLDKWYEENWKRLQTAGGILFFQVYHCEYFPASLLGKLEKIFDHETIIQNINRYISDKGCAEKRKAMPYGF